MNGLTIATGFLDRARGLMRGGFGEGELLIAPCRDIHTFGLRRPIDVAFIDAQGRVLESRRDFAPRGRLKCPSACAVVERWAQDGCEWYEEGQRVGLACMRQEER